MKQHDPAAWLERQFRLLQMHLKPFRDGAEGGLTALRFRLDRIAAAALVADDAGHYVAANQAASRLLGYRTNELERLSVWDLTPGADVRMGERLWAAFLGMGVQTGTYDLQAKEHLLRHVHYRAHAHVLPHVHVSLLHAEPEPNDR